MEIDETKRKKVERIWYRTHITYLILVRDDWYKTEEKVREHILENLRECHYFKGRKVEIISVEKMGAIDFQGENVDG